MKCIDQAPCLNEAPAIQGARQTLLAHPIYAAVQSWNDLRLFMADHVFAVWDFMSLTKRLQQDLTTTRVPWMPPANACAARLINEIVLTEESDLDPDGKPTSHLELYLEAMAEVGADRSRFDLFMALLREGEHEGDALAQASVPSHVSKFVMTTMDMARHGSTAEVCASFLFGREDLIPDMFTRFLQHWGAEKTPLFAFYLERHVAVDAEEHGPAATEMMTTLLNQEPGAAGNAEQAAVDALRARLRLWDGTLSRIQARSELPTALI